MTQTEALRMALEALETSLYPQQKQLQAITALRERLAQPDPVAYWHSEFLKHNTTSEQPAQQQEPVAWMPIEQMYPQAKAIDILMGDGSILCAVLPQFDGDLWWEGSGTGEKFIDPKYANVTHWRIHDERTSPPPQRKPLTDEEIILIVADCASSHQHTDIHFARAIETAHGIKE